MNILLIRLRLIGDVVFTTPIPRALKRAFPAARITYLVEPAAAPVVSGNPHLDEVIVAPGRAGLARIGFDLRLARRLRRARYDLVIDLHGGPRSAWLALATGAPRANRVRHPGPDLDVHASRRPSANVAARHSVVNQWDLLEAIDGWPRGGAGTGARSGGDAARRRPRRHASQQRLRCRRHRRRSTS